MEATITRPTTYTGFSCEAVEDLSARKGEPAWVRDARLAAWETYEQLPMPKRTDEEWRRTDLRGLKLDRLTPFAAAGERVGSLDGLLASVQDTTVSNESERAGVVVQRDASTVFAEIDDALAAQGVVYTDLDTAVRDYPESVQRSFMTQAVPVNLCNIEALHVPVWQGGH